MKAKRWGEGLVWIVVHDHPQAGISIWAYSSEKSAVRFIREIVEGWLEDHERDEEDKKLIAELFDEGDVQEALTVWNDMTMDVGTPEGIVWGQYEVQP